METIKSKLILILGVFIIFGVTACLDHDFDEPPIVINELPFSANSDILTLKSKYVSGAFTTINEDLLIHAIVVADDRSGNFYKKIVVQDSSAGIEILINRTGIYNQFPIGMKVGIKCKGLTIGAYNNLIQLGLGTYQSGNFTNLAGIEDLVVDQYIFAGPINQTITPRKIAIGSLATPHLSTLIQLENVEFVRSDVGKTYADAVGQKNVNLTLTNCTKQTLIIRSSGFASFAGVQVPAENGSVVGIFSVFGSDEQIFIRDTYDVKMNQTPCIGGGGANTVSIAEIRSLFSGSTTQIPNDKYIKGIVISDKDNLNIHGYNLQMQDASGGITVRFDANHSFSIGDEISVNVGGQELSEFDGLLQVNKVTIANGTQVGTGTVTAKIKTLAEINAEFESLESSLVQIKDVNISKLGGTTYSGSCILTDASGNLELYTRSQAKFSGDNFPVGNLSITGIVTQGGTNKVKQLSIRSKADVVGGNTGGGGGALDSLNFSFDGYANNAVLDMSGWTNVATTGTRLWLAKVFQGNVYAQATAFNDTSSDMETWLVTPKIKGTQSKILSFESAKAFWLHDGLSVLISTNYDGTNVKTATWQNLNPRLATQADSDNTFVPSGIIDLSSITSDFYIAFVYKGNNSTQTTTYRVDNIVIKNK